MSHVCKCVIHWQLCEFGLAIFAYSFVITFKLSKQHSIFEEKVYNVRGGIQSVFAFKWKNSFKFNSPCVC